MSVLVRGQAVEWAGPPLYRPLEWEPIEIETR